MKVNNKMSKKLWNKKAIVSVLMTFILVCCCVDCGGGTISIEDAKSTDLTTLNEYDVTHSGYN